MKNITYTWEQINQALVERGIPAKRIINVLTTLNKIEKDYQESNIPTRLLKLTYRQVVNALMRLFGYDENEFDCGLNVKEILEELNSIQLKELYNYFNK